MILVILSILHFLWHVALFILGLFLGTKVVKHCCKRSCHEHRKKDKGTTDDSTEE